MYFVGIYEYFLPKSHANAPSDWTMYRLENFTISLLREMHIYLRYPFLRSTKYFSKFVNRLIYLFTCSGALEVNKKNG